MRWRATTAATRQPGPGLPTDCCFFGVTEFRSLGGRNFPDVPDRIQPENAGDGRSGGIVIPPAYGRRFTTGSPSESKFGEGEWAREVPEFAGVQNRPILRTRTHGLLSCGSVTIGDALCHAMNDSSVMNR